MGQTRLIDAKAAAGLLGISRATLYAYVSRGLVGAEPDPADPRRRLYRAPDIERLRKAKARARARRAIADGALDWGEGALASRITLIERGRLYYRGQDAALLAETASLEDVARLLWESGPADPFAAPPEAPSKERRALARLLAAAPPLDRCRAMLPVLLPAAAPLLNRARAQLAGEAAQLLRAVAGALLGFEPDTRPLHLQLAAAWGLEPAGAELVRAALVLLADHELNPSTFADRVVAATGASLPACLGAGLAALSGPLHGGATALAEALLDEAARGDDPRAAIAARLARGEKIPAFGHPLYPDGDPRALVLLARLPPEPLRDAVVRAVAALAGHPPNVDFALASLRRALALPPGSGIVLFALARSAGWLAHAIEQASEGRMVRPRAEYVGVRPG